MLFKRNMSDQTGVQVPNHHQIEVKGAITTFNSSLESIQELSNERIFFLISMKELWIKMSDHLISCTLIFQSPSPQLRGYTDHGISNSAPLWRDQAILSYNRWAG